MRCAHPLTLVLFLAVGSVSAEAKQEDDARRCAFLGRCGSFHLIGPSGTAAYNLGNAQYIADLASAGEDRLFWFYRPLNGDVATNLWAFARQPDRAGRYWVWRRDQRGWRRYEGTRAWGIGLGESGAAGASGDALFDLQNDVRDLKKRVKTLEDAAPPPAR